MRVFNGTSKEMNKYASVLTENSTKCKCGHNVAIRSELNKKICSWCGNYVFRTKKDEFEYRMIERLKNARKQ